MATTPLRIVCFFAAVRGALTAPTVTTYDQRQHGEFNLRVDLDDVAVVLLPGDGAADELMLFPVRRNGQPGGGKTHAPMLQHLFRLAERRNGPAAKKRKKPADCGAGTERPPAAATTEPPPRPPSAYPTTPEPESPDVLVPIDYETPQQPSPDKDESPPPPPPAPVFESGARAPAQHVTANDDPPPRAGPDEYLINDPYSVTPSTPNVSDRNSSPSAEPSDDAEADMVVVQTVENRPAPERIAEFIGNVQVETAAPSRDSDEAGASPTTFEEKPISVSSDAKTAGEKSGEVKANVPVTAEDTKTAAAISAAATAAANDSSDGAKKTDLAAATVAQAVEKKPEVPAAELTAVKTAEKPTFAEALKADGKLPTATDGGKKPEEKSSAPATPVDVQLLQTNEKKPAAVETVVVKTAEKTEEKTDAVTKKPVDDATTKATASASSDGKPAATTVALKTAGVPPNAVTAVESGITTSTKPLGLPKDKGAAAEAAVVVSRLAKPTTENMVAVKTIENAAAVTTVGTVTAVKTVVKSGNAKTTLQMSNGSSILRKVADRKPLPSMTFDVATPAVVRT